VLSAIVLTHRNPKEIRPTLDSVTFADETLILDMRKNPVNDFSQQRNIGISKAKGDWVLFIDDDEVVPPALAREIEKAIITDQYSAYYLKRLDRYFDKTLHHGETGNTRIIRLAQKNAGHFVRPVHEVWKVNGRVGELGSPILHQRKELVSPFIRKIAFYGPIDARSLNSEGKPFSYWRLLANPLAKFIYNYKIKLGFLDGYLGLFQAYLMSIQSISVRVFQWSTKS
jgi:glycosyltransferase involved in cell wall biosynthesis